MTGERVISSIESHYAENVLMVLFWVTVLFMVYTNHTHNDEMGRWATVTAGNILSALFGILTGKNMALKPPGQPTTPA